MSNDRRAVYHGRLKWRITLTLIRPTAYWAGVPDELCKLRDDVIVPLICPTCQNFFREVAESTHASDAILLCMGLFSIFLMAAAAAGAKATMQF